MDTEFIKKLLRHDYTEARKVVIKDIPDAHTVWLIVGNQGFEVTPHGCESLEDAEWMRDMLAAALLKIVDEMSGRKLQQVIDVYEEDEREEILNNGRFGVGA